MKLNTRSLTWAPGLTCFMPVSFTLILQTSFNLPSEPMTRSDYVRSKVTKTSFICGHRTKQERIDQLA